MTSGFDISKDVINAANAKDVVVISTPYDTFTTSRLINQSMPIKSFMTRENLIHFDLDDYVDDVRDTVSKSDTGISQYLTKTKIMWVCFHAEI